MRSGLSLSPTDPEPEPVEEKASSASSVPVRQAEAPKEMPFSMRAIEVGRALEKGDLKLAEASASTLGETPPELLVKARLAEAVRDDESAVRIYHQMTDVLPEFEEIRIKALAEALFRSGRVEEAALQLEAMLKTARSLSAKEQFALKMKQAKWLQLAQKQEKALDVLAEAEKAAPDASRRTQARLARVEGLLSRNKKKEASLILEAAILTPASKKTLLDALALLKAHELSFAWSDTRRLAVATSLINYRAFDEAKALLGSVVSQKDEAAWLEAEILFKRRRHYKEALLALKKIVAGKGPHAEDAEFLAARALSRLDRDEEAIRAYKAFAAKTKRRGKAAKARFLAARLAFYLGRHKQAAALLERLVGKGTGKNRSLLSADDTRTAHFLAGLSELSTHQPTRARPHFIAASDGTSHAEVLSRNAYWLAVADSVARKAGWQESLKAICKKDPTDWYARMAALRLKEAGASPGPCALDAGDGGLLSADGGAEDASADSRVTPDMLKALRKLSALTALYAEAGFFKDAAETLRGLEKRGALKLNARDWISYYTALEAPQYAISKASSQFRRPPARNDRFTAEAAYPMPYRETVAAVEAQHNLPDKLIFAIARKESLFDPKAVSWVGAMGLMQMMPHTYEVNRKRAGLPPLKEGELPGPVHSIRAAGYEFKALFERFGSLPLAVMAYNGGQAAVDRWLERSGGLRLDVFVEKVGFAQTRNYVRRVVKNLVRYRLLYGGPEVELPVKIPEKASAFSDAK